MIDPELLIKYGAHKKMYSRGENLFSEGQRAAYFYQVISGEVKMFNYNDEGKEFIQGIFTDNDTFGEPPLLNSQPYLTNAETLTDSELWMLPKDKFLVLLHEQNDAALSVCRRLSDRLYYKSMMSAEISSEHPDHRLLRFFDFLKYQVAKIPKNELYQIMLTRQQLADLTGLRVETVIRTIKSLEKKGAVTIEGRKVFR